MKSILINNKLYSVQDTRSKITIADSFVLGPNKIGDGNGEAKLYVGYDNDELLGFFGQRGFEIRCFLLKNDLNVYLDEARTEYLYPTQDYRHKDQLLEFWDERKAQINELNSPLFFKVKDQNQIVGPRVYVNSSDPGYKLIREISLPVISYLNISKLESSDRDVIYYFQLFSDYSDEAVDEEDEISPNNDEFVPFDPMKISIDTKTISMDTILRRIKQGTINLNPDFQRNEVWTDEKKCRLIESLMLKIPLPMFYVSIDVEGNFNVVDGLQRLSTIRDFVLGKNYLETRDEATSGYGIKLRNLEFWGASFNNLQFKDLPVHIQNRIMETEFSFTIINPGTPEDVKRNIFKRINTGGVPLTDQEIRHALYVGHSTDLLKRLSTKQAFQNATDNKLKANRMVDREFILRCIAFIIRDYNKYPRSGDVDTFLSDTMRIINAMPDFSLTITRKLFNDRIQRSDILIESVKMIEAMFLSAMNRTQLIFGEHNFRTSYHGQRKTPINKALFETWGAIFSKLSGEDFQILKDNKKAFLDDYNSNFLSKDSFKQIVSRNALKQASVVERHSTLNNLVQKYLI
ncbi:GmrSD restriction endonuclease domain-containing protein [Mucilaginibacter sp.]